MNDPPVSITGVIKLLLISKQKEALSFCSGSLLFKPSSGFHP